MGRPFEQIENLVGYHRHAIGALIAEPRMRRNAMTMVVAAEAPPLAADAAGVFHVGNSRVTLDTVIGAFCDGATAEEIADQYPAISLGQVYACGSPTSTGSASRTLAFRARTIRPCWHGRPSSNASF
jgi:hypothetical protein